MQELWGHSQFLSSASHQCSGSTGNLVTCVLLPALPLTCCVALGGSLSHLEPHSPMCTVRVQDQFRVCRLQSPRAGGSWGGLGWAGQWPLSSG